MGQREWLYVFCYDISRDKDRRRLVKQLEEHMARVQYSVFEGMMAHDEAKKLAERCAPFLGIDDSSRVYALSSAGHARSFVFGAGYLPEPEGYYLL